MRTTPRINRLPAPSDDTGAATVIAGMLTFALVAALVPAGMMYHQSLRDEMNAHVAEARHQVDVARTLATQAKMAAEAASEEANRTKQEGLAAQAALDLITALSDATEANAELAKVQADVAKKGAFCARNPDHPDCPLEDNEWLEGYSCARVGNGDILCTET